MKHLLPLLFVLFSVQCIFAQDGSSSTDEVEIEEAIEAIPADVAETHVFSMFEVQKRAHFKGGDSARIAFIKKHMTFPTEFDGDQTVVLSFVIEKSGAVTDIRVGSKRSDPRLDKIAIGIIDKSSGQWVPAEIQDSKVRMRMYVPIRFNTIDTE